MTARVLLVTGSRALADTPAAEAWSRTEIARAIADYAPTMVVAGDARGPDTWAAEAARALIFQRWQVNGYVATRGQRINAFRPWPESQAVADPRRRPLERNRVMVRAMAERVRERDLVSVLALTASWATTHGTEHTAARAREWGLMVDARDCPRDLGPGGARG